MNLRYKDMPEYSDIIFHFISILIHRYPNVNSIS